MCYTSNVSDFRGRPGFDVGREVRGACRGRNSPRKISLQTHSCKRQLYLRPRSSSCLIGLPPVAPVRQESMLIDYGGSYHAGSQQNPPGIALLNLLGIAVFHPASRGKNG